MLKLVSHHFLFFFVSLDGPTFFEGCYSLHATNKLRTQLLFQNSHPIVQEDLERLQANEVSQLLWKFNLDWTSEPEETCSKVVETTLGYDARTQGFNW